MLCAREDRGDGRPRGQPLGWLVLGLISLAVLASLGATWWSGREDRQRHPAPRLRLDINRASAPQLQLLPGVGSGRAARIVAARDRRGGFRDLRELDARDLLGPGASRRLAPYLMPIGQPDREAAGGPSGREKLRP
jgi:hypothetical protein